MAKLTTENLQRVLDACVANPNWKKAMGVLRASESLAFVWRAQSIKAQKDGDTSSPFFIEWRGTWDYWHAHAGRARTENVILHEATIRDQSLNGVEEPVFGPDQKPVWKERAEYIGRSDQFIRDAEILAPDDDVAWYRLERDADGNPVQLTKRTQIPAPLRLAVLKQDKRYIEQIQHDVNVAGEITVAKPLQRLPGEVRPDVAKLRALASMTPDKRREQMGASGVPLDAHGHRTMSVSTLPPEPKPQPSYARQPQNLDTAGTGRGEPPPGGFKVR
jgi:hypothetical protein